MTEYISEQDFAGRNIAIVRDERGTRVAFKGIPYTSRILALGVLVIGADGRVSVASGGEASPAVASGSADELISAWASVLRRALAQNGVGVGLDLRHSEDCPFHGTTF